MEACTAAVLVGVLRLGPWAAFSMVPCAWSRSCANWRSFLFIVDVSFLFYTCVPWRCQAFPVCAFTHTDIVACVCMHDMGRGVFVCRCQDIAAHAMPEQRGLVVGQLSRQQGMRYYAGSKGSYKRGKGGSHTVEKRISMLLHKPHATSQPSRFSHTPRLSADSAHNQHSH